MPDYVVTNEKAKASIVIRSFQANDIDIVSNIDIKAFDWPWAKVLFKHYDLRVAEVDYDVQGFVALTQEWSPLGNNKPKKDELWLLKLAVAPAFHNQGIGERLMETVHSYKELCCISKVRCMLPESTDIKVFKWLCKHGFTAEEVSQNAFELYGRFEDGFCFSMKN